MGKLVAPGEGIRVPFAMAVLAFVFFAKAFYLAFFVTPLWDVPDETGHLAYVMEVADGKGLPNLRKSMIPAEVMSNLTGDNDAKPTGNWISQHPPLYYYIAAIPYKFAEWLNLEADTRFRSPRIVAAICGALLLVVVFRTAQLIGTSDMVAACFAGCLGWIPMLSHLSSGTNHDVPLFLLCALAAYYLISYVLKNDIRQAYVSAGWMALAGFVKMTAWVMLPVFLMVVAWEIKGGWRYWFKHMLLVGAIALSLPIVWILRNLITYGDPFFTASTETIWQLKEPLQTSFAVFLSDVPFIEHFVRNFYGLIGWVGSGGGQTSWFQIDGVPLAIFTGAFFALTVSLLIGTFDSISRPIKSAGLISVGLKRLMGGRFLNAFGLVGACLCFLLVWVWLLTYALGVDLYINTRLFCVVSIFSCGIAAVFLLLREGDPKARVFFYGLIGFAFFSMVISKEIYNIFLLDGRLRAAHGRYFYPVAPLLLASMMVVASRFKWAALMVCVACPFLIIAEVDSVLIQIVPFYENAK